MFHNKQTGNSNILWNRFGIDKKDTTMYHRSLYALTHPRNTLYVGRRFKRAMSLEKKIEAMENEGRKLENHQWRVRARNVEKRVRIMERRSQLKEKRILKLRENRRLGCGNRIKLTIEPGKCVSIVVYGSPTNDGDYSVSTCSLSTGGLEKPESFGVFQPISRSKSLMESQFCKDSSIVDNDSLGDGKKLEKQNYGVRSIVKDFKNLSLPKNQEEESMTCDISSPSNQCIEKSSSTGNFIALKRTTSNEYN